MDALGDTALPYAIELIAFSEEEGVRFRKPFLGSLAVIGALDESALDLTDSEGTDLYEAIEEFGLDPERVALAELDPASFAYLELHIEQGPVLEAEGRPIAAVSAIVGQTRMSLLFRGQANHAGTTPMRLRHDALAAAAEWVVKVEAIANATPELVATVGSVETKPGLGNVIAAEVNATLDVRHAEDAVRRQAVYQAIQAAQRAADSRGVALTLHTSIDQVAVPMAPHLTQLLVAAAETSGCDASPVSSGAGHDAVIVARRIPAAMLFLRSPGGLSHHPGESVIPTDVQAAFATAMEFLRRLGDDSALATALASARRYGDACNPSA
jgi:allantoate deiminase